METLTIDQLKKVPWNGTVNGITYEPPLNEMGRMVNIPFKKRDRRFPLFYCWAEIIKSISGENQQILDACCGKGMISQVLLFKGHRLSACDLTDYFKGDRTKINFRQLDLNFPMPYPDDHFDYVINCEGLQYLKGISHFLNEAGRVLKNGGHLILSIPNIHNTAGRFLFLRKGRLINYHLNAERIHWQIIYMPYLVELLKAAGFRILKVKGNIPNLSYKIRIINATIGKLLFEKDNRIMKIAHSLIIDSQITGK
jgi:SAM-dependent methyltransferase